MAVNQAASTSEVDAPANSRKVGLPETGLSLASAANVWESIDLRGAVSKEAILAIR